MSASALGSTKRRSVSLLSGIGPLIGVFSTRLARVADQVDKISETVAKAGAEEKRMMSPKRDSLRMWARAIDIAVILGSLGGCDLRRRADARLWRAP